MTRLGREHLGAMSDEGENVKRRRERLGIDKSAFAEMAGIHRNTLNAIERGDSFNRSTLTKIERVLAAAEREAGLDSPPPAPENDAFIEFRVEGLYGAKTVVVKGPVADREALLEAVERLMRGRGNNGTSET